MQVVNRASQRTCKRILQASIELFNCHGVQNVSLESIAARLGISRGNLTYHFKRKQELLHATLIVLEQQLREALAPPTRANEAQYGAEYMLRILHALWDFRFFFNDLAHLLTNDPQLREQYLRFEAWTIDTLDHGLRALVERGDFLSPRAPNSTRLLAENMWSQWRSWLHMQQIDSPAAVRPEGEAFYDCALHNWSLLEPYFTASYARELLLVYRRLLLADDAGD